MLKFGIEIFISSQYIREIIEFSSILQDFGEPIPILHPRLILYIFIGYMVGPYGA